MEEGADAPSELGLSDQAAERFTRAAMEEGADAPSECTLDQLDYILYASSRNGGGS